MLVPKSYPRYVVRVSGGLAAGRSLWAVGAEDRNSACRLLLQTSDLPRPFLLGSCPPVTPRFFLHTSSLFLSSSELQPTPLPCLARSLTQPPARSCGRLCCGLCRGSADTSCNPRWMFRISEPARCRLPLGSVCTRAAFTISLPLGGACINHSQAMAS